MCYGRTSRFKDDSSMLPLTVSGWVTLLLGGASLLALLFQNYGSALGTGFVALVTLLLLGLDVAISRQYGEQPPRRVAIGAVVLHALLVETITLVDGLTYTAILYLTLPFPAFFLIGRRTGLFVSLGLLLWFTLKFILLKPYGFQDPASVNTYILFLISLALITAMAQVVQRERANRQRAETLLADLEASHIKLALYAEQVAELATIEERNRLARDIHDSLGHYLTVIGVQLEKALIVHEDNPTGALEAVGSAKRLTDSALNDVRQSVGMLRRESTPFRLRPALDALLAETQALPFKVALSVNGDESGYSAQQLSTLYRAVQEGLTNVHKHAHAQSVRIQVEFGTDEARLHLADDGVGLRENREGGFGLRGIRERLELVSGRLVIDSRPNGGTHLTVTIPRGLGA
jgi:signal transduction histidine kinase